MPDAVDAGIRHDRVQAAEMTLRPLDHLANVRFIRNVTGNSDCLGGSHQSFPRFGEAIFVAVEEHEPMPCCRKKFCRGPADSRTGCRA